jgi:hypothetical protein
MSYLSRYDKGNWNALCDVCGRQYKASSLQQRWDGLKVCKDDWEPRQPQDFVRGVADQQAPPWTRPEPQDSFIPFVYNSLLFLNGILSNAAVSLALRVVIHFNLLTLSVVSSVTAVMTRLKINAVVSYPPQTNGSQLNKTTLG